jgi:hypothetical protein
MRGVSTLTTRVRRLEKQRRGRRLRSPVLYVRYDDDDGRIVGLGTIAVPPVSRSWGEALASLAARARAGTGQREPLIATYPAPAPEIAPVAAPAEPVPPAAPAFDPKRPEAWRDWRAFAEEGISHEDVSRTPG